MTKRILHVNAQMNIGGIEKFIMNMYRNLDKSKYEFDFLMWNKNISFYEEEIQQLGGNIYKLNLNKNIIFDFFKIINFLKEHKNYDVIHCHSLFYSAIFILAAKICNIRIRITHFHSKSDNEKNSIIRKIYKYTFKSIIKTYSTHYCACSEEAAIYGFDKINDKVFIINNGIDIEEYQSINEKKVNDLKKKYNLKDKDFIVGTVGRFSEEKNQKYIIEIIKKLKYHIKNVKCILVGDGPLRNELETLIKKYNLEENFVITGKVNNVAEHLKLLNVFLFPSKYEGFGISLLESQATGVYSISSNNVPNCVDMNIGLVKFLPTDDKNIDNWVEEILNNKNVKIDNDTIKNAIKSKKYDLESSFKELEKIYNGSE